MKKFIVFLFALIICGNANASYEAEEFKLMFDQVEQNFFQDLPKATRFLGKKVEKTADNKGMNLTGLDKLNISGSAQFTKHQLANILTAILQRKSTIKKIYIVDLRQESHGFVGNLPFRFYVKDNAINQKVPLDKIDDLEDNEISKLENNESLNFYYKGYDKGTTEKVQTFQSEDLKNEKEIVKFYEGFLRLKGVEIEYIRFHLQDHHFAHEDEIYKFKEMLGAIDLKDTWIHFHCAGGRGRTSSFMIMTDMFFNKTNVPFEHFLKRQAYLGGSDFTAKQTDERYSVRYNQLQNFYNEL